MISLILITCDRFELFERAFASCLAQSYQFYELVVIDDGLTPIKERLTTSESDIKITYHWTGGRKGAPYARNVGIKAANGIWVTFLDDDDYLLPSRLSNFSELVTSSDISNKYSAVGTTTLCRKEDRLSRFRGDLPGIYGIEAFLQICVVGISVFVKRDYLIAVGLFDEEMTGSQDWELWIRLVQRFGPMLKIPSDDYIVTFDSTDRITTSPRKALGFQRIVKKHRDLMNNAQVTKFLWLSKYAAREQVNIWQVTKSVVSARSLFPLKIYIKLCIGK